MKVRMKVDITGTRNGERWPARGTEVTVPDQEGADLCAQGLAEPVAQTQKPEKRSEPDEERVCDVCGKTAKSAAGLAAHQRSHDED